MDIEQAQNIISECTAHTWFQMGLRDDPPPDISAYSLSQLVEANNKIKEYNEIRTDKCQSLVMDDRLIAALYALSHFHPQNNEPVVLNKNKALLVVRLPDNFFDDQDAQ